MDSRSGKANLMFNLMKDVAGPRISVTTFVGLSFPSYKMKVVRTLPVHSVIPWASGCSM